jgi:hypothetical protein
MFRCVAYDHTGDADFIGARNVSIKTRAALGHVQFPGHKTVWQINEIFSDGL